MSRSDHAPVATWLLALAGLAALLPAGTGGTRYLLAVGALLCVVAVAERRVAARLPQTLARAADLLTVTSIVGLAASSFALGALSLRSVAYVLAGAQLTRAVRRKTGRDLMVMNGTAVAQLAIASFLTRSIAYLPVLGATVVFGVAAGLSAREDKADGGEIRVFLGRPAGRAGLRSRLGAALQPMLLAAGILAGGILVFVLLPRGAPFRRAVKERTARARADLPPSPAEPALPGAGRTITGFTEGVSLGQIGEVKLVPREAFRVRLTDAGLPVRLEERLLYFRGAVLDAFDGRRWTRNEDGRRDRWLTTSGGTGRLGIHPELGARRPGTVRVEQEYTLRASSFRALPILPTVVGIDLGENLPRVFALGADAYAGEGPHTEGFTYSVLSLISRDPLRPALVEDLPPEERSRFLRLHEDSTRIAALAREVAGDGDALEKADRLLGWLAGECSYTLRFKDRPPARPLEHFLFETRAGHCEYFASALAIMLRAADVPSRLVTGFRGGLWIEDLESFFVRMSDAHAWVEAFVPDRGWVRLDPTPPDASAVNVPESRVPGGEAIEEDWLGERFAVFVREFGPEDRGRVLSAVRDGAGWLWREGVGLGREERPWPPPLPVLGAVLLGTVLVLRVRRALRRGRGGEPQVAAARRRGAAPPAAAFYDEALRVLGRHGFARRGAESPREFLGRVTEREGARAAPFRPVTQAFECARYGLSAPAPEEEGRLRALVRELDERMREIATPEAGGSRPVV